MHKYQGNQCLYVQKKIATNNYQIEVFHKEEKIANYNDISPTVVWDKTKILKNFNGNTLFGIDHTITIDAFKKYSVLPICNITGWNDIDIMTQAFEQCLKRSIAVVGVNWYQFFVNWKEQPSTIIEFTAHLKNTYPADYVFTDREFGAWRAMMKKVGCTKISPYKRKESKLEFWTCSIDYSSDHATLEYLYTMNLLNAGPSKLQETKTQIEDKELQKTVDCFWKSFDEAMQVNKHGLDGKQRILSIITKNFGHREIQNNLQVTFKCNE
ncbi:3990_t:CDS:2 [Entrophospora sp. SA101]|nr:3990_t:CDS:2 [Entrophospora sp. SA101]